MSLSISRECQESSDPIWECDLCENRYFASRMELPGKGERIIIAMAGNPKFFMNLAEYGHVFEVDPAECPDYAKTDGIEAAGEEFMRWACTDEHRRALMTVDGEAETVQFINGPDRMLGEYVFKFTDEHSRVAEA